MQRRGQLGADADETTVVVDSLRAAVERKATAQKAEPVQKRYIRELFAQVSGPEVQARSVGQRCKPGQ